MTSASVVPTGHVAVFAPALMLTVTVEPAGAGADVHLHAGGQGFWVAHLAAALGADVVLSCAVGGEAGNVVRGLAAGEGLTLRAVSAQAGTGVYIHDRRSGERQEIVRVDARPLDRHATDELYGVALGAGLEADVTLVCGCEPGNLVAADLYRRLVSDLRANGRTVMADLTGPPLDAALAGGVSLLKLSDEELVDCGLAAGSGLADLANAARQLAERGAVHVVITRAEAPALVLIGAPRPRLVQLTPPVFEALDHRGAGDSLFAATGVGLARGMDVLAALRLGMAAGALNVTRHGLGTGTRDEIARVAQHVIVGDAASVRAEAAS